MQAEPLIVEKTLQAPVSKVWKALTDSRQIQSWYFDIPEFKAEPGFEFVFYGGDGDQIWAHYCRVLEAVKEKKLSYTWKYDEWPDVETVVTFELFAEGTNATRVRVTHVGLEKFPQDRKSFRRQSFNDGWTYIVGTSLADYVEKPFIEYTLPVHASPARIWELITSKEMIRQWAGAFAPGTYVETDWKVGSAVVWKAGDETVGATGKVVINETEKHLRVEYDDRYAEAYKIQPGKLLITCGPISEQYEAVHRPMWEQAVAVIKKLSE